MPKIFQTLDKVKPVFDKLYKASMFICKLFLVADILVTCYSVFGRLVPFIPPALWAEEIILTIMSYMVVISAALAIRKNSHIRMTIFDNVLPPVIIKILNLLADILIMMLAIVMIVEGWEYAVRIGSVGTYSTVPWLSRFWKYFPVPVAGVAMVIFEAEAIYDHIRAFWVKEDKR